MKYIVYLSTAIKLMNETELEGILTVARENNARLNITGILLYSGGTFIQVIEGEPTVIDQLLAIIERDPRHKNLVILDEKPLKKRNFPEWTMGFSSLDPSRGKELAGHLASTDHILNNDNEDTIFSILKTFIDTNNLVVNY